MSHPEQERLLEFAAGAATEADAETVYSHLAECGPCHQRFQVIRRLRRDFEGSWNAFIEEAGLRLADQTSRARPETEPMPGLALALRGILDGSRRLATAAREQVSGILEGGRSIQAVFVPSYQGVADPEDGGEARRFTEEASTLCLEGEAAEALERLEQAARRDAAAAAAAQLDLVSGESVLGRVVVDASRRSVSLLVHPGAFANRTGTAVLTFADVAGEPVRRCRLRPVDGAPYLLAEFEDLPDGAFTLELEI